jgi:hypothetical protein
MIPKNRLSSGTNSFYIPQRSDKGFMSVERTNSAALLVFFQAPRDTPVDGTALGRRVPIIGGRANMAG